MTLSAVDWGRQVSGSLGPERAVAVFHTPDLTLMWANDAYEALLDPPYRSHGAVGMRLDVYSELEYAIRAEALKRVGGGGDLESGEERLFSVEDGNTVYRWSIHPVCPSYALEVIDIQQPVSLKARRTRTRVATKRPRTLRSQGADALARMSQRVRRLAAV